ncbi:MULTISPECIES: hypothetical protein [Streptomycetaceae]|uniref:hypothetical protein n=1 Tax=Streptomycetaceae TaxID=2062 RepID=UPI00093C2F09|nr:hypothetical protein [Streptomyces sp. CB02056]OKH97497.1 hypothetical protein AMK13_37880 [Streptomyces sp. CB02056]
MSSELVRVNPPNQPPSTLPSELTDEQTALLLEIATPYTQTGVWPIWDYVVKRMDQRRLDARIVIASLPRVGSTGTLGPSYGFTAGHDRRMLGDGEPVRLTVAAALVLDELRPLLADPFLRVLHHMIALQRAAVPSPTAVTQTWLNSQELAEAIPSLTFEFMAALPQILDGEPSTWRGSGRGQLLPDGPAWAKEITREIQEYAEATDVEAYVATVCRIVTAQAWEQNYHHVRAEQGVPLPREYATAPWLDQAGEETAEPPAAPQPSGTVYVKQALIEELVELDRAGRFSTDKLVQQCKELNFNYRHEQPFSCHALLRAIIDHVPPAFGEKGFAQVASSTPGWTKTDKDYLKKLQEFRTQGDDVLHRTIGPQRSRIDMHDVPAPAALNALLEGLLKHLRQARDAAAAGK